VLPCGESILRVKKRGGKKKKKKKKKCVTVCSPFLGPCFQFTCTPLRGTGGEKREGRRGSRAHTCPSFILLRVWTLCSTGRRKPGRKGWGERVRYVPAEPYLDILLRPAVPFLPPLPRKRREEGEKGKGVSRIFSGSELANVAQLIWWRGRLATRPKRQREGGKGGGEEKKKKKRRKPFRWCFQILDT